jgi:hypothetical protein
MLENPIHSREYSQSHALEFLLARWQSPGRAQEEACEILSELHHSNRWSINAMSCPLLESTLPSSCPGGPALMVLMKVPTLRGVDIEKKRQLPL